MIVHIKNGKESFEVDVESEERTVGEVKDAIVEHKGPSYEKENIRLIFSGRLLSNDSKLSALKIDKNNFKLTMVHSKPLQVPSDHLIPRIRDDLTTPSPPKGTPLGSQESVSLSRDSRFGGIQTLPLPMQEKAKSMLIGLANEPGIIAVMKKHNWTVGILAELFPERPAAPVLGGKMSDQYTLLGLNENAGQRILLRLRTDDLQGFRDLTSIRKTLCHELAHNVHGDHDDDFFRLWRQIEREIVELDWKKSTARRLNGATGPTERYQSSSSGGAAVGASSTVTGGIFVLGGDDVSSEVGMRIPAGVLAGQAAVLRRTQQEIEMAARCGCGREQARRDPVEGEFSAFDRDRVEGVVDDMDVEEKDFSSKAGGTGSDVCDGGGGVGTAVIAAGGGGREGEGYMNGVTSSAEPGEQGSYCLPCDLVDTVAQADDEEEVNHVAQGDLCADDSDRADMGKNSQLDGAKQGGGQVPSEASVFSISNWVGVSTAVMAVVDECIAVSLSTESVAPIEKLFQLREAIEQMLNYGLEPLLDTSSSSSSMSISMSISGTTAEVLAAGGSLPPSPASATTTAQLHSEADRESAKNVVIDAFVLLRTIVGNAREMLDRREVNCAAKVYQRLILATRGAESVLTAAGFERQSKDKLKLTRVDAALLYMVFGILDTCIHTIDTHLFT